MFYNKINNIFNNIRNSGYSFFNTINPSSTIGQNIVTLTDEQEQLVTNVVKLQPKDEASCIAFKKVIDSLVLSSHNTKNHGRALFYPPFTKKPNEVNEDKILANLQKINNGFTKDIVTELIKICEEHVPAKTSLFVTPAEYPATIKKILNKLEIYFTKPEDASHSDIYNKMGAKFFEGNINGKKIRGKLGNEKKDIVKIKEIAADRITYLFKDCQNKERFKQVVEFLTCALRVQYENQEEGKMQTRSRRWGDPRGRSQKDINENPDVYTMHVTAEGLLKLLQQINPNIEIKIDDANLLLVAVTHRNPSSRFIPGNLESSLTNTAQTIFKNLGLATDSSGVAKVRKAIYSHRYDGDYKIIRETLSGKKLEEGSLNSSYVLKEAFTLLSSKNIGQTLVSNLTDQVNNITKNVQGKSYSVDKLNIMKEELRDNYSKLTQIKQWEYNLSENHSKIKLQSSLISLYKKINEAIDCAKPSIYQAKPEQLERVQDELKDMLKGLKDIAELETFSATLAKNSNIEDTKYKSLLVDCIPKSPTTESTITDALNRAKGATESEPYIDVLREMSKRYPREVDEFLLKKLCLAKNIVYDDNIELSGNHFTLKKTSQVIINATEGNHGLECISYLLYQRALTIRKNLSINYLSNNNVGQLLVKPPHKPSRVASVNIVERVEPANIETQEDEASNNSPDFSNIDNRNKLLNEDNVNSASAISSPSISDDESGVSSPSISDDESGVSSPSISDDESGVSSSSISDDESATASLSNTAPKSVIIQKNDKVPTSPQMSINLKSKTITLMTGTYNIMSTSGLNNNCLIYAVNKGNIKEIDRSKIFTADNIEFILRKINSGIDNNQTESISQENLDVLKFNVATIYSEIEAKLSKAKNLSEVAQIISNYLINGSRWFGLVKVSLNVTLDYQFAAPVLARHFQRNLVILTPQKGSNSPSYAIIDSDGTVNHCGPNEEKFKMLENDDKTVFIFNGKGTHYEWLEKNKVST